jgi:hypothetical protein
MTLAAGWPGWREPTAHGGRHPGSTSQDHTSGSEQMNIAFSVVVTGATIWAASVLGVLVLGIAARRNDPRVVVDDPWERPDVAARWQEHVRREGEAEGEGTGRGAGPATGRKNPRSAA